jgi:hypothetical protein
LTSLGPEGTALALLILGHVLADFTFQTDAIAKNKDRNRVLLKHGGIVLLVHLIAFSPLLTVRTVLVIVGVGVTHVAIDAVTSRLRDGEEDPLLPFFGDQIAHMLILIVAWSLIGSTQTWTDAWVVGELGGVASVPWPGLTTGAVYVSALAFAKEGGNVIVCGALPDNGPESDDEDNLEAGSLIGTLERWIIIILGIASQWEAVALVVAVKSIARFKLLDRRDFAEYFLIGTLASLLVAITLVILVSALV